jgi:hypothetical protein
LKKSVFDKWWSALIGQAFFAPVFLFFLWLSLRMTTGLTEGMFKNTKDISWSGVFLAENPSEAINLVMMYLVVMAFLIGSIIVSKTLSNMAGSSAGKITGFIGGTALGAASFAGRNTIGRFGNSVANSGVVSGMANSRGNLLSPTLRMLGGGLMRGGDRLASSSMDVRNVGALSSVTSGLGTAGGAGGFGAQLDRQATRRQQMITRTGQLSNPEQRERAERNRQISNQQRQQEQNNQMLEEVNDDAQVRRHAEAMVGQEAAVQRARANLERVSRSGVGGRALADATNNVAVAEGDLNISRTARNTARNAAVARLSNNPLVTTFDHLEGQIRDTDAEIREINRQNTQQMRNVATRTEQALTEYENSFLDNVVSGLNRNRISTRLRNSGNNR